MAKTKLKTFYLFDENGGYVGPIEAEECPTNATEIKPEGTGDLVKHPVWNGESWDLMTHEDIILASKVKGQRNNMLSASDFTQVMDFQGDVDAWAKYRQELRDITKQKGFPSKIEWSEKPSLKPLLKAEPKK